MRRQHYSHVLLSFIFYLSWISISDFCNLQSTSGRVFVASFTATIRKVLIFTLSGSVLWGLIIAIIEILDIGVGVCYYQSLNMLNHLVVKPAAAETLLKLEELEKELDLEEILSFRSMAECNLKGQVSSCLTN